MRCFCLVPFMMRRFLGSRALRRSLLISELFVCVSFTLECLSLWGRDVAELPSAAVGWMGNYATMDTAFFIIYPALLMFPLASMACGDVLLRDRDSQSIISVVSRRSITTYVCSGASASFVVGFATALVPLVFSMLLPLLVFPLGAGQDSLLYSVSDFAANVDTHNVLAVANMPLSELYVSNRYLHNMLFCLYDALWAGIFSLVSFSVSLFVRNRLVVLGMPTVLYLLTSYFFPPSFVLMYHLLDSTGFPYNTVFMIGAPPLALAAGLLLIGAFLFTRKEVSL